MVPNYLRFISLGIRLLQLKYSVLGNSRPIAKGWGVFSQLYTVISICKALLVMMLLSQDNKFIRNNGGNSNYYDKFQI